MPDGPTSPPPPAPPSLQDVLKLCAAAAPDPWFPATHAGPDRDALHDPVWTLHRAGLVHVADWVRGRGQGFKLTPAGEKTLESPELAPPLPAASVPTPVPTDEPADDAAPVPRAVVAPALLIANVGWFVVGLVAAWKAGLMNDYLGTGNFTLLHRYGAVTGNDLLAGEWWRLGSSVFVHVGLMHLLSNMVGLAVLGPMVEALFGRWRFLVIYAVAGLAGSCGAMAVTPAGQLAGASGAIWGVQTALLAWVLRHPDEIAGGNAGDWVRRISVVIVASAVASFAPGVSWPAHFAGGAAGFVAAIFIDVTGRRRLVVGLAGVLAVASIAVGGLGYAMSHKPEWTEVKTRANPPAPNPAADAARAAAAQVAAALNGCALPRAEGTYRQATLALIGRGPTARRLAAAAVDELANAAADGLAVVPPTADGSNRQFREYFEAVRKLAATQGKLLAADHTPSQAEWKELREQFAAAQAAWQRIGGR